MLWFRSSEDSEMRSLVLSAVACSAVCLVSACGGDDSEGGGGGGGNGASCVPQAAECYVAGPTGPGAECMAKHDNTGQTKWQGRLTSILVKSPAALSQPFIQASVIDKGISLKQGNCWENGDGTFSWLFEIDSTTNKMKTGGSLPITDPKAGGCFVKMPAAALPIAPIEVDVSLNGLNFSAKDLDVNVPIFLSAANTSNPIILPLHKVEIQATFADDSHNCSGKFNGDELDPALNCTLDTTLTPPQRYWTPGGSLKGYITIDEADQVVIDTLKSTLCVVLAGWTGEDTCKGSAKWAAGERPEGDWCAATNSAATTTCNDAYKLEGEFSASAFKITGDCP